MTGKIAKAKVTGRNAFGEYIVKAYDENNKRMPEADYFTNDKQDAEETAKLMVKGENANVQQNDSGKD